MTKVFKKNKILFYIEGYAAPFLPHQELESKINALRKELSREQLGIVERRLNYYNQISEKIKESHNGTRVRDLLHPKKPKAYYFDTFQYAKYFDKNLWIDFTFGDVNTVMPFPMIVKSRPIGEGNENSILLNLDKARHFVSVNDDRSFESKKNKLIGRAAIHQQHRIDFYKQYFSNPLCDLGQINKSDGNPDWIKPKISIAQHLDSKFILSLEGNDVATNLKWIMSSNSIAVCPPLKMETWYMEGTLKPDQHFIGINADYSNLEEKLQYYIDRPKEALEIIESAKQHRNQFKNKNIESLISILVLKKYFNSSVPEPPYNLAWDN